MPTINYKGNTIVADKFEGEVDGSVAFADVTGTQAGVEAAVAAKTEIAALVSPATDYADLAAATAAIKSIIDALKA